MHYEEFRQTDPALIPQIVAQYPLATLIVTGAEGVQVLHTPLIFKPGSTGYGAVEFHVARANAAYAAMQAGAPVVLSLLGPHAHISPAWYLGRFPDATADRGRTAPTWNYLSLVLRGRLEPMPDAGLVAHLEDLVSACEGPDGWRFSEVDPGFLSGLTGHIAGFRVDIADFDCIVKFNQDKDPADRAGVVQGLQARGGMQDAAVARLVEDPSCIKILG